eukprot:scaffold131847_cov17-Tisochrysis_lutea.AAC.1
MCPEHGVLQVDGSAAQKFPSTYVLLISMFLLPFWQTLLAYLLPCDDFLVHLDEHARLNPCPASPSQTVKLWGVNSRRCRHPGVANYLGNTVDKLK